MTSPRSTQRRAGGRVGFTLIEMVIVILIILILLGLTIAVVGSTISGDRVRGGARQVQNYLAGARDRAIYAASRIEEDDELPPAIGVRFLPDPNMTTRNAAGALTRVVYNSMVFVQEVDPLPTRLTVYREEDLPANPGVFKWKASQFSLDPSGTPVSFGVSGGEFTLRSAGALILRGLVPGTVDGTYYLPVYFDRDSSREPYFVKFTLANLRKDGSATPPANLATLATATYWLYDGELSKPYFDSASDSFTPQPCRFRVLPSVMPSEEPRLLPQGCVIDGNSSSVGGSLSAFGSLLRPDGSFDVMFNSRGIVEGPMAAVGQVHLYLADSEDVERGFQILSPWVNADASPAPGWDDADGDGDFDERRGEEFIVSVRTQTGSIYTSEVGTGYNAAGYRTDPFLYADGGGQAR